MAPVAVVVGVGEGISGAVARRFAREGCKVALVGRTAEKLAKVEAEIKGENGQATSYAGVDAGKPEAVADAFARIRKDLGDPDILVYNAAARPSLKPVLDITAAEMAQALDVGFHGAFLAAQQVLPAMVAKKQGTIIFTGATAGLRGGGKFLTIAAPKFALRALSQSIAREYGPKGVHSAYVIIDGIVDLPDMPAHLRDFAKDKVKLKPDAIAAEYWRLHTQDPTAWTQEMDLRPYAETF
eukprot:Unigene2896_Nuclearia_a/m.8946 Unigene2896_Nuclearia_a/g.8946  ORF Unigene2896_Nuclearia_a/g.8946 Unigene2896_Nuclearia_a/m.8946 type:complete len:240 (+) Unigene2896_Nuclearia_a:80-799(+)